MKSVHRSHDDSEDYSCTSCIYKSPSDSRPSLKNLVAQGSRIDRLYYGKYIPLREKKLLDRLVRTRAVYDDIRAQLISDSMVDLNAKANLRARKKLSAKEFDSTDKSSTVLKLLNMVDKGEKLGSKNLSECCSCCNCSSGTHLYKESIRKRRHKRGHPGVHRHDHHVSRTMGDSYTRKKGVRFKAKHIRSDPCTCTFKLSDLLKKHLKNAREFITEPSSEGVDIQPADMEIKQKKRTIVDRISSQNLKRPRERVTDAMLEGIKKLKESKIQLQENLEGNVRQSIEKLIHAKQKLIAKPQAQKNIYEQLSNIDLEALCVCSDLFFLNQRKKGSLSKIKEKINESKSQFIRSLEANAKISLEKLQKTKYKFKSKQENNSDIWVPCECPELDSLLLIQKDSVAKLKDDMRKKQVNHRTSESQNIKQTCTPEKCINKFKHKFFLKAQGPDKYELNDKISLDKLQKIKDKLNSKRETYYSDIWAPCECPELDSLLLIQKESMSKLRNDTKNKQVNERINQSESIKNTCTPEQCFNKFKQKLLKVQARDKYELNEKISLEKLPKTKDKHETYNSDIWVPCECPELDSLILIQKDSVAKLKDATRKKQVTDRTSKSEGIKNTCVPEECYNKLKRKHFLKALHRKHIDTRNKQVNDRTNQSEIKKNTCTPEECFNKLKHKLLKAQKRDKYELNEKISLEKLQKTTDKLKSKHETYNSDIWVPCECPELDSLILIQKDSVAKLKNDTRKKQVTDRTSEFESKKKTCTPEECFNKLKQKLKSQSSNKYESAIVTLENLQNTKDKLKSKHETFISDIWTPCDCPELDLLLLIQKDSIAKYRDDMRKKQMIKDRTCESECMKNTCIPEQCLNRLKQKLLLKAQDRNKYEQIKRRKFIHQRKISKPLTQFSSKAQLFQKTATLPIVTEKVTPKLRRQPALVTSFSSHGKMRKKIKYEKVKINKPQEKKARKKKHKNLKSRLERTKSNHIRHAVRIGSSFSFNVEFYKDNKNKEPQNLSKLHLQESYGNKTPMSLTSYEKNNDRKKINRRHRSSLVIHRPKVKDARIGAHALNRCFCPLKLHDRKKKKNLKEVSDKSMTTKASEMGLDKLNEPCTNQTCLSKHICTLTNCTKMKTNALKTKKKKDKKYNKLHLLPFECEPGVCTPNYCDPHQCVKLIDMRNTKSSAVSTNFSQKTKSTSTVNSKLTSLPPKPTYVQSVVQYTRKPKIVRELARKQQNYIEDDRQIVRIGSTFSFNIEFYKNKVPYSVKPTDIRKDAVKPKQNLVLKQKLITQGNRRNIKDTYRTTPTQIIRRNRHYGIGNSLKRCFCTLKLQEKCTKPEKRKMLTTGTKTKENFYLETSKFNRSTMIDRKKRRSLESFECEPFVCIPGQCNPYVCLERIKRRFKDVSVITTQPHSKTGSSTMDSEISGKTTQVDIKPRVKHEKSFAKRKQKKGGSTKGYDHSDNFRQEVKLGSSFSFNVEFFKSNAPNHAKPQYLEAKKSKISKDHTSKKKIKMNRFNVANIDTQVQKKNKQKSSMVTPLLKRCFCTLNLQKKLNLFNSNDFPLVYTINRAITKEFRYWSCLNLNKAFKVNSYQLYNIKSSCKNILPNNQITPKSIRSDVKNKINPCVENLIDSLCLYPTKINKWEPIKYESRTKFHNIKSEHDINLIKKVFLETKSFISELSISDHKHNIKLDFDKNIIERLKISSNNLKQTGPSLFKRSNRNSFCTMNLQIERQKFRKSKLLPYECEPGVCIPGECNPYECQKLILGRAFKKTSKFGTEYRTQSVSIQTAPKVTKNEKKIDVREPSTPRSYKKPHTNNNNRVVRIGSSFNFDVEFFKNATNLKNKEHERYETKYLSDTTLEQARPSYTVKNVGTKKPDYFQDRPSQSPIAVTTSKASVTLPVIKRCFCTLKLQKRGKLQNKRLLSDPADYQIPSKVKTTNRTQNTKDFKTLKHKYHIEPYECEPNICNPGNCDPHECLELMKKKQVQEIGVHTGLNNQKSVTSMTTTVNRSIETQSRGLKQKIRRARSKHTKTSNKPSILKPSKQMVRVGSNFSFSVEFFKDRTAPTPIHYVFKDGIKRSKYNITKHKDNALQNKRLLLQHKKSQLQNFSKVQSKITSSLLKRCFCTAKFYQSNQKNIGLNFQKDASPSFFQRCLCLFKNKKNVKSNHNKISHLNKKTSIRDNISFKKQMIDRFKCEPGICNPGECDPYECDGIFRNKIKRQSIASSNEIRKSRSSYTYNSLHSRKRAETQAMMYAKPVLTKFNDDVESSKKQAVRIGSKFSFDIEFYKNNIPMFKKNVSKVPQLKYGDKKDTSKINETLIGKNSSHKLSQVIPSRKKNRAIGIDKVLKRCFCTLQFYNKPKDKLIGKAVKTKSIMTEKNKFTSNALLPYECEPNICIPYQCDPYKCDEIIKSRQYRGSQLYKRQDSLVKQNLSLLPYECEPFSCIPGECNPVECMERIKNRRLKSYGTNIKYSHGTESTMTKNIQPKHKRNQSRSSYITNFESSYVKNTAKDNYHKPAVKIGSKFSFDVEFYKENSKNENMRKATTQKSKIAKLHKLGTYPQHIRFEDATNTSHTKINKPVIASFLKKCFCTLQLHKKDNNRSSQPKNKHIKKDQLQQTALLYGNYIKKPQKLKPFECEPNTCVPGLCDPYECEKRIKRRLFREFSQKTEDPVRNSRFIATQNTKTKSVKSQATKLRDRNRQFNKKSLEQYQDKTNLKRQVCRIGSTFSFDITFSKTRYPKEAMQDTRKLSHESIIQTITPKNKFKSSLVGPKRCFCTLKLQKFPADVTSRTTGVKRARMKTRHPQTAAQNYRMSRSTYCDPYECEKETQFDHHRKRDIQLQADKNCCHKCVGVKAQKLKTKKNQSKRLRTHGLSINQNLLEQGPEIVEVPRFSNTFDKQGVKLGSNFTFNIEFYKKTSPSFNNTPYMKDEIYDERKLRRNLHKNRPPSQISAVISKDKALDTENVLKRCFCTLSLHKNMKKLHNPYPQVLEVRRVSIPHKTKRDSQPSYIPVASVSTRINNKYLNYCSNNNNCPEYLNNNLNEMKTILPYKPTKFNKIASKTLLSQQIKRKTFKQKVIKLSKRGKKLTKKKSLRGIHFDKMPTKNNELRKPSATSYINNMLCRCVKFFKSKTKNYRTHYFKELPQNTNFPKDNDTKLPKQYSPGILKLSKSDRRASQNIVKSNSEPKKSKSVKLSNKRINSKYNDCPYPKGRYSLYQAGDNFHTSNLKSKDKKHIKANNDVISKDKQIKNILKDPTHEEVVYCMCNAPKTESVKEELIKNQSLCMLCQTKFQEKLNKGSSIPRLKVRFLDPLTFSKTKVLEKEDTKQQIKKSRKTASRPISNNAKCCRCLAEIKKEAGDHYAKKKKIKNNYRLFKDIKNIRTDRNNTVSNVEKPLLGMEIDAGDFDILNKEEVIANVTRLSEHNKINQGVNNTNNFFCKTCCKTTAPLLNDDSNKVQGKAADHFARIENIKNQRKSMREKKKKNDPKKIKFPAFEMQIDADYDIQNKEEVHHNIARFSRESQNCICNVRRRINPIRKVGPCICGSIVCAEKSKKMSTQAERSGRLKKLKWKPCACGSPVCDQESQVMKSISLSPDKVTCICKQERKKEKKKLEHQLRSARLKQQHKEDEARRRQRKKEDKLMEKRINKNASDMVLLAESVVDIGKLGITACADILRFVARTATDPKQAYISLKAMKDDPKLILRSLKHGVSDSGVGSTMRRVRLRCMSMRGVKNLKSALERHPFTNYLLHIASKDPKRREAKKKARLRERFDFGCSLYMSSLRKRPFLFVYDRLPSFYPHFLALVNVYRQFRDLMLFLLAVVVWSPCILCMEVCRAMMCCLFCTG